MHFFYEHRMWTMAIVVALVLLGFVTFEVMYVKLNGSSVAAPDILRGEQVVGSGKLLNYAILGDSTAVGQGGDYKRGIVKSSVHELANSYEVHYTNYAVSGARTANVLSEQLPQMQGSKPDIVLIAVGANDVTHMSNSGTVQKDMERIIKGLRELNGSVKIVMTGAPDMGAIPRFPQPLRAFMGSRAKTMNQVFDEVAQQKQTVRIQLAEKTGPEFARNSGLFASDKFHPNDAGYAVWEPVINEAIRGVAR